MSEFFVPRTSLEDVEEELKSEFEVDEVQLICESMPLTDRKIRMYAAENDQVLVRYDTVATYGESRYDADEVHMIGRGDRNLGLSRLMRTYCSAPLDAEGGCLRLEE